MSEAGLPAKTASFWIRLGAVVVDYIFLLAATAAIKQMIRSIAPGAADGLTAFFAFACTVVYYGLLESSQRQASIGKMVLGIRVTNDQGGRLTSKQAFGRAFIKTVSIMPPFLLAILSVVMLFCRQDKKSLHDLVVHTEVVRNTVGLAIGAAKSYDQLPDKESPES